MPGKINPTLSEMVIQIAHQVVGNDVAVSMATTRANLTSTFGMPPSTPKISGFGAVDDVGKRPISLWHKQTPGILGVDFYPDRLYNIL